MLDMSLLILLEGGGGARRFLTGRVSLFFSDFTESVESKGLNDRLAVRAFVESLEAEFSVKGLVALSSSSSPSLSSKGLREAGFCSITGSERHRKSE